MIELETIQHWGQAALPVLLDAVAKGVALLAVAYVVVLAMRKSSAAARQLVWVLALAGLLALPVVSVALPSWQVLPGWARLEVPAPPPASATALPARVEPAPVALPPAPDASISDEAPCPVIPQVAPPADAAPVALRPKEPTAEPAVAPLQTTPVQAAPIQTAFAQVTGPAPRPFAWTMLLPWALALWALGTLVCLAPLVLGRISLWRLARTSRRVGEGSWTKLAARAAQALGLRRPVVILQSDQEPMPMVWGALRARLLLPAEAESWPPPRRWVVLLHEMAHAKRYDCLAKLVAHVACAAYWFNPLCWVAFKLMQREAEAACDDLVLAAGRGSTGPAEVRPSDYAQHLLELASGLKSGMLAAYSSIAMARPSKIEGRLLAILDPRRNRRALTRWAAVAAIVLCAGLVIPISIMRAAGNPEVAESVRQLQSNDEAVWKPAVAALIKIGPIAAEPVSRLFAKGGPGDSHAVEVLTPMAKDPGVQKLMLKGLDSGNSNVVHCSLIVLGKSGNRAHVSRIVPLLDKSTIAASIALSDLGGDEAFQALLGALNKPNVDPRWLLAQQLADFGKAEAIPELKKALTRLTAQELHTAGRYVEAIHKLERSDSRTALHDFSRFHAAGDRDWSLLEGISLSKMDRIYIQPFEPAATPEQTRAKALKALASRKGLDLAWERSQGDRLLAFNGTLLAPYTPAMPASPKGLDVWSDGERYLDQRLLAERVWIYNAGHGAWTGTEDRSLDAENGIRAYPFKPGDYFLALLSDGTVAVIQPGKVTTEGRHVCMKICLRAFDPLYKLVPAEAFAATTQAATQQSAVEQRSIAKKLKGFPEAADLSTPEAAWAAFTRAWLRRDAKAVVAMSIAPIDRAELEDTWKQADPKRLAARDKAMANSEAVAVLVYKGDLAAVISKLEFVDGAGRDPYSVRALGRIGGKWKNLGEDRCASLQDAVKDFDRKKDTLWEQYISARAATSRPTTWPAPTAHGKIDEAALGPVIERTLSPTDRTHNRFLDLKTGKMFDLPGQDELKSGEAPPKVSEIKKWAARKGVDLMAEDVLVGFELAVFPQPNRSWDVIPPKDTLRIISESDGQTPAILAPGKDLPTTFYFKTREGCVGVLQIVGYVEKKKQGELRGIKIQYRFLVGPAATEPATQPDDPDKAGHRDDLERLEAAKLRLDAKQKELDRALEARNPHWPTATEIDRTNQELERFLQARPAGADATQPATQPAIKRPGYYAFWLTNKDLGQYVDLLIARAPILQRPAGKFDAAKALRDTGAIVVRTYAKDSIWNVDMRPFKDVESVASIDFDNQSAVVNGKSYRYAPASLREVIALLERPRGTIGIHRIHAPLAGAEEFAKALLADLKARPADSATQPAAQRVIGKVIQGAALQIGDEVEISVKGDRPIEVLRKVGDDGTISLPGLAKPLRTEGMPIQNLEVMVANAYGLSTQPTSPVSVVVVKRNPRVFYLGMAHGQFVTGRDLPVETGYAIGQDSPVPMLQVNTLRLDLVGDKFSVIYDLSILPSQRRYNMLLEVFDESGRLLTVNQIEFSRIGTGGQMRKTSGTSSTSGIGVGKQLARAATYVLWMTPSDKATTGTRPADSATPSTSSGQARPATQPALKALPDGFVAVKGTAIDPSGYPKEIRCLKDDSLMVFVPAGEFTLGLTDKQVDQLAKETLPQGRSEPSTKPMIQLEGLEELKPGKNVSKEDLQDIAKKNAQQQVSVFMLAMLEEDGKMIPQEELNQWRKSGRTVGALLDLPSVQKALGVDAETAREMVKEWTQTEADVAREALDKTRNALRASFPGPQKIRSGAFYIDKYEITNRQYHKFFDQANDPNRLPSLPYGPSYNIGGPKHPKFYYPWKDSKYNADDQPVTCVGQTDVLTYAKWAGKQLPTRDQWQRAALGEGGRLFPWGSDFKIGYCRCDIRPPQLPATEPSREPTTKPERLTLGKIVRDVRAVRREWRKMREGGIPSKVGQFPHDTSPYGCCDMAGNVSEWVIAPERGTPAQPALIAIGGSAESILPYLICPAKDSFTDPGKMLGFRTILPVGASKAPTTQAGTDEAKKN